MKRTLTVIVSTIFLFTSLTAQLRYEDLDTYSKSISEIQYRNQPIIFNNLERNFPLDNFKVFYSTKLASLAYFVGKNQELVLTETIDLTKVKSIYFLSNDGKEEVVIVELSEPVEVTVVGEQTKTHQAKNLPFFYPPNNYAEKKLLYETLSELILLFKKESEPASAAKFDKEYKAWKAAEQKNSLEGYNDFIKKNPGSIFITEATNRKKPYAAQAYRSFFDSYKAGYNRPKKYLELWGNWKPGVSITAYDGKEKDIKDAYKTEGFTLLEGWGKAIYYHTGIKFAIYLNWLDPYNNFASTNRNALKFGKNEFFPRGIAINPAYQVVGVSYRTHADISQITEYLGCSYDRTENRYSNSSEYIWYFNDCTIEYEIINGTYETTKSLRMIHHDKSRMSPAGTFTFQRNGETYEVTTELWNKYIK